MDTKNCTGCNQIKPMKDFYKSKHEKFGAKSRCKLCCDVRFKRWRNTKGLEKVKANNAKYYSANRLTSLYRFTRLKSGAKQRGITFLLSYDQFMSLWDTPCYYCGDKVETAGIDRIDSDKGYEMDNIVRCCEVCNRAKSTLTQNEFIEHISKIYRHLCS